MQSVIVILALVFALIIVAVSLFLPPQGEVHESVIYIFAQLLIFCASILGVDAVLVKKGMKSLTRAPTKM